MCGCLLYEGISNKIGHIVPPITAKRNDMLPFQLSDRKFGQAQFLGHCRDDNPYPPENSVRVKVLVKSYTEKNSCNGQHISFNVPDDHAIDAYLVSSNNFKYGRGLFLVTRAALPAELKLCDHNRHPRFIKR